METCQPERLELKKYSQKVLNLFDARIGKIAEMTYESFFRNGPNVLDFYVTVARQSGLPLRDKHVRGNLFVLASNWNDDDHFSGAVIEYVL